MKKKTLKIVKSQNGLPKDLTNKATGIATLAATRSNTESARVPKPRNSRIPPVGTIITRNYKGEPLQVKVLEKGFEYKGQVFKSISALAVHIVGASISGYVFFKL